MKEHSPLDFKAQEAQQLQDEKSKEILRQIEAEDFMWMMEDPRGRRIMWRLLEMTGIYRSSFTGNSETFFREGARNVGLQLVGEIHSLCPEKYSIMTQEQRDHAARLNSTKRPN
jgi:hypothetical protein